MLERHIKETASSSTLSAKVDKESFNEKTGTIPCILVSCQEINCQIE